MSILLGMREVIALLFFLVRRDLCPVCQGTLALLPLDVMCTICFVTVLFWKPSILFFSTNDRNGRRDAGIDLILEKLFNHRR